jgi:hypothetical protein
MPLVDLPPRSGAQERVKPQLRGADDDTLPIEDLPPRKTVTGG